MSAHEAKNRFPLPALAVVNQPRPVRRAVWRHGVGASNHFGSRRIIRSREEFAYEYSAPLRQQRLTITASNAVKEHGFQCHVDRCCRRLCDFKLHTRTSIRICLTAAEQDWQSSATYLGIPARSAHQSRADTYAAPAFASNARRMSSLDEFVHHAKRFIQKVPAKRAVTMVVAGWRLRTRLEGRGGYNYAAPSPVIGTPRRLRLARK